MNIAVIVVIVVFGAIAVIADIMIISDELDWTGGVPLIALCIFASFVAYYATWWLGIISWSGSIIIMIAIWIWWDWYWPDLEDRWRNWKLWRYHERKHKKYENQKP